MDRDGIKTAAIHGNKSQNARTKALDDFKSGRVEVLVATDIAARGIDISELPLVVNYELPHVPEDYVHRIGRTGRNGLSGDAFSLVSSDERDRLRQIERMLGRPVPVEAVPADLPPPPPPVAGVTVRAEDRPPLVRGGRGGRGGGQGHGQGARAGQGGHGGGRGAGRPDSRSGQGFQGQDRQPAQAGRSDGAARRPAAEPVSYAPTGNGFGRAPAPRPSHADGVARRFGDDAGRGHGHGGPRRDHRGGSPTSRPA